jgi:hypothetical protein
MLKFIWTGWADPYESLSVPTLIDEKGKILWQGGYYYSGEVKEKLGKARKELQEAAKRFNVEGYDFSSNDYENWMEYKRTWSNDG